MMVHDSFCSQAVRFEGIKTKFWGLFICSVSPLDDYYKHIGQLCLLLVRYHTYSILICFAKVAIRSGSSSCLLNFAVCFRAINNDSLVYHELKVNKSLRSLRMETVISIASHPFSFLLCSLINDRLNG